MDHGLRRLATGTLLALAAASAPAAERMPLPAAPKSGGMPLMEALARRSTSRSFDTREISPDQLSGLLWAAFGVNRADGKRTAPSAHDYRETDVYVLRRDGAYLYDAREHALDLVLPEDVRALGGRQSFVRDAPLTLVFVTDFARMGKSERAENEVTAAMDVGFISQNVYLYCASQGLATGVRVWVDGAALAARLGLRKEQRVVAAQSVGHPGK